MSGRWSTRTRYTHGDTSTMTAGATRAFANHDSVLEYDIAGGLSLEGKAAS